MVIRLILRCFTTSSKEQRVFQEAGSLVRPPSSLHTVCTVRTGQVTSSPLREDGRGRILWPSFQPPLELLKYEDEFGSKLTRTEQGRCADAGPSPRASLPLPSPPGPMQAASFSVSSATPRTFPEARAAGL